MLRHLVEFADQLEAEDELPPLGYHDFASDIDWVVEMDAAGGFIRETSINAPRPNRERGSAIRPLLLADKAYYALGIAEEGKEKRAKDAHKAFIGLLQSAAEATADQDVKRCVKVLRKKAIGGEGLEEVGPHEVVAFADGDGELLCARPTLQDFWSHFVADNYKSGERGTCSVCGKKRDLLQTLPQAVYLFGQKSQLTSFNRSAFESYGKDQTLNSPLCYPCGARAAQVLNYLRDSDRHRVRLTPRSDSQAGLQDQLALFWTTARNVETETGEPVDVEAVLGTTLGDFPDDDSVTDVAELERLLEVPWHARESALRAGGAGVNLLVLSPNKGRVVVREWLSESLERFRKSLRIYLNTVRIESPWGDSPRPFSVQSLLEALSVQAIDPETGSIRNRREIQPFEARALLRTAYASSRPPVSLQSTLVRSVRTPAVWNLTDHSHRLMALLKLTVMYNDQGGAAPVSDTDYLERLEESQLHPGYLCGRLLAVVENAQRRASEDPPDRTVVDRHYSGVATAPAATLPRLLNRVQTAYLPKMRTRDLQHVADGIQSDIEEILSHFTAGTGFPKILDSEGQGQLALGFYHQRAANRRAALEQAGRDTEAEDEG